MSTSRRLPPFKSIEAFVAAARARTFTEAAISLNITVPAISRRIRALELELGVQLFQRTPHTLRLTKEGSAYILDIQPALEIIREASVRLRGTTRRHSIKVSLPPSFAANWLIPRLPRFHALIQDVEVELKTAIGSDVDFDHTDADVAIRISSGNWAGLRPKRLLDINACPVSATQLLKEWNAFSGRGDILRYPLLGCTTRPEFWRDWLRATGVTDDPPMRHTFDNFNMLYQAAANGLGIAIGLDVLLQPFLDEHQLVPIFDSSVKLAKGIYLGCREIDCMRRPVRTFCEWLDAEASVWRNQALSQSELMHLSGPKSQLDPVHLI